MMAEQVLNIGCNNKSIPDETWADDVVLESSKNISLSFLNLKKSIFGNSNSLKFPYFVNDYLEQICIPEILANSFCDLGRKNYLKSLVVPLESFQTFAVSLHDQIEDSHLMRGNEPTILKRYGLKSTINIKKNCENIYSGLAKKLEKFIPNAEKIAKEQYDMTLTADKIRNSKRIFSPSEAIILQDKLAGIPSQKIAILCNGDDELQNLAKAMGNSLSTIDDLIDLIILEDLKKPKTTIPLSYLVHEHKQVLNYPLEKARDYFLNSNAFKKTIDYINKELIIAEKVLNSLDIFKVNMLSIYKNKM
jgi:hypothetical protein